MATIGSAFPGFSLPNQDGQIRHLEDFRGNWLVLYVYPKDDTPGCTIQGKAFTETKSEYERLNVKVVGISADDVSSHKDFCQKYALSVELLADPAAELLQAAGVKQSDYKGTLYWNRTTFLIDPNGVLRKIYENVNPQGHEKVLLSDIQQYKGAGQPKLV